MIPLIIWVDKGDFWLFLRQGHSAQNYDLKRERTRIPKATEKHSRTKIKHAWCMNVRHRY